MGFIQISAMKQDGITRWCGGVVPGLLFSVKRVCCISLLFDVATENVNLLPQHPFFTHEKRPHKRISLKIRL